MRVTLSGGTGERGGFPVFPESPLEPIDPWREGCYTVSMTNVMHLTEADLPRPGGKFAGLTGERRTIIASVWGNDIEEMGPIFGTVIFLRSEPPYYEVGQIEFYTGIGWVQLPNESRLHRNIVFAVEDYQNSGGDV